MKILIVIFAIALGVFILNTREGVSFQGPVEEWADEETFRRTGIQVPIVDECRVPEILECPSGDTVKENQ